MHKDTTSNDDEEQKSAGAATVGAVNVFDPRSSKTLRTVGEPYAVRTILGWAILGTVKETQQSRKVNVNFLRCGDETLAGSIDESVPGT